MNHNQTNKCRICGQEIEPYKIYRTTCFDCSMAEITSKATRRTKRVQNDKRRKEVIK